MIEPSDLRQAIAYADGVRIITPSITACPPTIKSRSTAKTEWMNRSILVEVLFFMFLLRAPVLDAQNPQSAIQNPKSKRRLFSCLRGRIIGTPRSNGAKSVGVKFF